MTKIKLFYFSDSVYWLINSLTHLAAPDFLKNHLISLKKIILFIYSIVYHILTEHLLSVRHYGRNWDYKLKYTPFSTNPQTMDQVETFLTQVA